jgi:cell division septal protein FtsQ
MELGKRHQALSRADRVRQLKARELQQKQTMARQQTTAVRATTPVFTRYRNQSVAYQTMNRTQPRRVVYHKMAGKSAEVRFPAMPAIRPGWKLLSGFLAAICLLTILFTSVSANFRVSKVSITGLKRLTTLEVESSLDLAQTPVVAVDTTAIAQQLAQTYPELSNIKVRLSLPSTVTISALERAPFISWSTKDHVFWIDTNGTIFPERGNATPPLSIQSEDLPPLSSLDPSSQRSTVEENLDPNILHAILELSSRMPNQTNLIYSAQDGLGWIDQHGWKVFLGMDFTDLSIKVLEYQAIAAALEKQGIQVVMISVERVDAPFFRTE